MSAFLSPPVPVCTHTSDLKMMGRCVSVAVIELHCSQLNSRIQRRKKLLRKHLSLWNITLWRVSHWGFFKWNLGILFKELKVNSKISIKLQTAWRQGLHCVYHYIKRVTPCPTHGWLPINNKDQLNRASRVVLVVKNSHAKAGDAGDWRATVSRVTESRTRLKWLSTNAHTNWVKK